MKQSAARLNILLVEDNEDDYIILSDLLGDIDPQRFTLEWANSYEEGLKAVQATRHDLILLDFRLSYHTGLELLQETQSLSNRAPVIFMTGQGDYETDVQSMQSGATDYLVKDRLNADLLERAIRYAVERHKAAEALRSGEERYRTFVENSTEGIWRFELEPPLSVDWPEKEQVAHLCRYAKVAECNDAVARLYGFGRAANVIGETLGGLLPLDASEDGGCLCNFVRASYKSLTCDAFTGDRQGGAKYVSHTLTGVVENGFLHRVWGTLSDITERRHAELAQRQLVAIVESSMDAIISQTLDGMIVTWNKGAEAIYGFSASEVIGRDYDSVVPTGEYDSLNLILEPVRRGEGVGHFDTVQRHKDGRLVDVSLSLSPMVDPSGQVTGISTIARDITADKHAERMLQSSEANMAIAQRIAHFGSWEMELGNSDSIIANLLHCSDETFRIFGYEPGQTPVTPEFFFHAVPPEDQPGILQAVGEAISQRQGYSLVHRVQRPDGQVRIVRETAQFFEDETNGHPPRLVGTVHDITERSRAEEALRESERGQRELAAQLEVERARLVAAQAVAMVGSWETDLDTLAVHWSAETYRIFEVSPDRTHLTHQEFLHIVHPEDRAAVDAAFFRPLGAGETSVIEHRLLLPDGRIKFVEERWRAVEDDAGRHVRALGTCQDITKRRQAEETRDRFITVLDATPDFVGMADSQGRNLYLNSAARTMMGIDGDAEIAELAIAQCHPADAAQRIITEGIPAAVREGVWTGETAVLHRDGHETPILQVIIAHKNAAGQIQFFSTIGRDITERKQNEQSLALRDQAIRASANGILIADMRHPEMPVVFANPAFERITGYTTNEALGRNCRFLQGDDTEQSQLHIIRSALSAGETASVILHNYRKDGTLFWNELSLSPLHNAQGVLTHYVGVQNDITERVNAEEERDRFFTLSLDMLAISGSDGYFKRLNPAFEVTLGFSNAELMSKPFLEFVHPDDIPATLAEMAKLESGAQVMRFENRFICRDGSYKWLLWMTAPFGDLWYCVAHDVTATKKAAEALRQANDDLETRVAVRTQALQLSIEEAERANAAKSEFLSRMSHELRTPMNSILGFAQIMEMDAPTDAQSVRLGHIMRAGQHLLQLINEVLDIARVEAGRLQLSSEAVSLGRALRIATDMIRPLCQPRDQRIVCDWAEWEPVYVKADKQRLSQVLINLLSNAVKFNRDSGVILVHCEHRPEGSLRVRISDSGAGIPADQIEKLFQPFERLGAEGGSIEGTGLGLALSKRLIELMDGTIGVESVVGVGSTFWVELPVADSPVQSLMEMPSVLFSTEADESQHSLLSIEDNDANRQVMEHILSAHPRYELLSATGGLEGLRIARSGRPSLILLDLHLPDLPGIEVLSRLQSDPVTRDIPVVIVSADATPSQIRRLMDAGAAEYLTKPLDVRLFLDVLRKLIYRKVEMEV